MFNKIKIRVSIITVCLNAQSTIAQSIESVMAQSYGKIEHIVIDGASTDGTLDVLDKYKSKIAHLVSEPDNGIYHAMNKGLALATGEIIGILNADDAYYDSSVIETVVAAMQEEGVDSCYGDLVYMDHNLSKVIRYWRSSQFYPGLFRKGWHPPHPTFFVKRWVYEKYGGFNTSLRIAADYELMLRFLEKHRISTCYIPKVLVKMRTGGTSNKNLTNIVKANIECYKAWRLNGLSISSLIVLRKPYSKARQYFSTYC